MTVQLLYFGMLKDFFEAERDVVNLHEGATVGELLGLLKDRSASDLAAWKSLAVAVNREYAGLETALKDGDEVALLPPVSGGSTPPTPDHPSDQRSPGTPVAGRGWGT